MIKKEHFQFSVYVKIIAYTNLQMLNSSYLSINLAYHYSIIIHLLKFPTSLTGIHLKNMNEKKTGHWHMQHRN